MEECPAREQLEQFLSGQLSSAEQDTLCEHVEACPGCQQSLDTLVNRAALHGDPSPRSEGLTPPPAFLDRLKSALSDHSRPNGGSEGISGEGTLTFLAPSTQPGHLGRFGHYEVRAVVGRGGMGKVFEAFDEVLQRVVAIKVLAPQLATSRTARQRFLREARAAGAIGHENVVAIHGTGEEQGVPFLVMQFIAGMTLQDKLDREAPLSAEEVLRIGLQTARGLAAAHAHGLIHRDIKPSNLLVENGSACVKITDFGLARSVDDDRLTQTGVVAGTPLFMSPEQANGEDVDERADLFSLGSVLYALCTGHPPFRSGSTVSVLKRVCEETPRPIREINPAIPVSLAALIARLHAKDRNQRFQSAAQVAEEFERILASPLAVEQPNQQAAAGAETELLPAASRGPVQRINGTVVVGLLVACLSLVAGAFWFFTRGKSNEQPTPEQNPGQSALFQVTPKKPALFSGPFAFPEPGMAAWMDQSPDGKILAVPRGKNVVLFETPGGKYLRTLQGPAERVTLVKFSPDNQLLAASADRNFVRVWETDTGKELFTIEIPTRNVPEHRVMLTFAPESKHLITAVREGLGVWDARSGKELQVLDGDTGGVHSMAFRPTRRSQLAVASWLDNCVQIWDWDGDRLKEFRTLEGHTSSVRQVVYSPDGRWLASLDAKKVTFRDAETLQAIRTVEASGAKLAFTPDSRVLYVAPMGSRERTYDITRWDVESQKPLPSVPMEGTEGSYPYLSRDGKVLYVCEVSTASFMRVFDAVSGAEQNPRPEHADEISSLAVSPDGKTLGSGGVDGTVRLWDLERWQALKPLPRVRALQKHTAAICSIAFSPDQQRFVTVDEDATAIVWNLGDWKEIFTLSGLAGGKVQAAFSPDGRLLAAGMADGSVCLWDAATGMKRTSLRWHTKPVRALAFSSDGRRLASAGDDGEVRLGEMESPDTPRTFTLGSPITALAWSPDDRTLAACSQGASKGVRMWDLETNKSISPRTDIEEASCVTFHPKSLLLAVGSKSGHVYFLDRSGAEISSSTFPDSVTRAAFIAEGRYLAASRFDGVITFLRTPKPAEAGE